MTITTTSRPLDDLLHSIGSLAEQSEILETTVEVLSRHQVTNGANVALISPGGTHVEMFRANLEPDMSGQRLTPTGSLPIGDWFFHDFLATTETFTWEGELHLPGGDPATQLELQSRLDANGILSGVLMPMRSIDGPIGVITFLSRSADGFEDHHVEMLSRMGKLVGMTLEKARLIEKLEARLALTNATTERLSASNRDLEEFAYVASHDLQEPLRKIRAFGDRLESKAGDRLTEQEGEYLERVRSAAGRMQSLINDLLEYSRVNTRGQVAEPVSLETIVAGVLSDLEIAIAESDAVIDIDPLPVIDGDATQLRQLFQNLIGNAIKFRSADQDPIVKVSARTDGETMHISVADNGIGFDDKYLDRIFKPFQRLHGRSEYSGSGIGLAVCRRIAERHAGNLDATSAPGVGSTFTLSMPMNPHNPTGESNDQ